MLKMMMMMRMMKMMIMMMIMNNMHTNDDDDNDNAKKACWVKKAHDVPACQVPLCNWTKCSGGTQNAFIPVVGMLHVARCCTLVLSVCDDDDDDDGDDDD